MRPGFIKTGQLYGYGDQDLSKLGGICWQKDYIQRLLNLWTGLFFLTEIVWTFLQKNIFLFSSLPFKTMQYYHIVCEKGYDKNATHTIDRGMFDLHAF